MYYIAAFKSTTQTYSFCSVLCKYNALAKVQETPRQTKLSCGLCVAFDVNALTTAKKILQTYSYNSFVAIYLIDKNDCQRIIG